LNQERKRKERPFRNVFILAHPISLQLRGGARQRPAIGKTQLAFLPDGIVIATNTHQNRATKLYPR
jgi:hypothetical protein